MKLRTFPSIPLEKAMPGIISTFVFWIQEQPIFKVPKYDKIFTQKIGQLFSKCSAISDKKKHPDSSLVPFYALKWISPQGLQHIVWAHATKYGGRKTLSSSFCLLPLSLSEWQWFGKSFTWVTQFDNYVKMPWTGQVLGCSQSYWVSVYFFTFFFVLHRLWAWKLSFSLCRHGPDRQWHFHHSQPRAAVYTHRILSPCSLFSFFSFPPPHRLSLIPIEIGEKVSLLQLLL